MTTTDLTPRQRSILRYIAKFQQEHGYPPTIREIGVREGILSTNGVMCHIEALEKKGFLRRHKKMRMRALRLLGAGTPTVTRSAAGVTIRCGAAELRLTNEQAATLAAELTKEVDHECTLPGGS